VAGVERPPAFGTFSDHPTDPEQAIDNTVLTNSPPGFSLAENTRSINPVVRDFGAGKYRDSHGAGTALTLCR
jgi:hypothetical protein